MICKKCKKEGFTSKVFPELMEETCLGWFPYYDEEGNYHSHNPNQRMRRHKCSNGHSWTIFSLELCPAEQCNYGGDLCEVWPDNE